MHGQNRKIYTLTELAASLKSIIEKNYAALYWVKAEIAKLNHYPRSGHAYPELVEKADNKLLAQFRGNIWASDYININNKFIKITGEALKDGMLILCKVSVSFHPVYGLSLTIIDIEPSFTLGEMAIQKAKTIERLKSENIFDKNKTLPFPLLPKKIAVISVETSKGYSDYLKILKNYSSKYQIFNKLFPAILQGDQAVKTILKQLQIIKKFHSLFDAVAIIRGGGGDIGLNCYNDYELAREIANFPIPVISGIGHATNETVTEMISWTNKITPTDVAYFFLGCFEEFFQRIKDAKQTIVSLSEKTLAFEKQHINQTVKLLISNTLNTTERNKNNIEGHKKTLRHFTSAFTKTNLDFLRDISISINQIHNKNIIFQNTILQNINTAIKNNAINTLRINSDKINLLENNIKLVDPANVLKKGYSISIIDGKIVNSVKNISKGQKLITKLTDGFIESDVIKTNKL